MQYVGQRNNIRLRMNGHKSDYRRFLNGDFSKSDTSSLYRHIKSHDVKIFKFQILEFLEDEGLIYTKDIRQLKTCPAAKERHWIWKLETLTPQELNAADTFHSQNRSSRKKRSRFFTFVWLIHIYICVYLCRFACAYINFQLFFYFDYFLSVACYEVFIQRCLRFSLCFPIIN